MLISTEERLQTGVSRRPPNRSIVIPALDAGIQSRNEDGLPQSHGPQASLNLLPPTAPTAEYP